MEAQSKAEQHNAKQGGLNFVSARQGRVEQGSAPKVGQGKAKSMTGQ